MALQHARNHADFLLPQGHLPTPLQRLLDKIAVVEDELAALTKRGLMWDDEAKMLKKQKLLLRDQLASLKQTLLH